jgi:hypothetical protein
MFVSNITIKTLFKRCIANKKELIIKLIQQNLRHSQLI